MENSTQHQPTISEGEVIVKDEVNCEFNEDLTAVTCGEIMYLGNKQVTLICGFCKKSYPDMSDFGVHIHDNHQKHINQMDANETLEFEFVDELSMDIGKVSSEKPPIRPSQTSKEHHEDDLYCPLCKKRYTTLFCLLHHIERSHDKHRPCLFCDKTFPSLKETEAHEKTHCEIKPFTCPICPKRFQLRKLRDDHIHNDHKNAQPYKCIECDRLFSTGLWLFCHQTINLLACQTSCKSCGAKFAFKCQEKDHDCLDTDGTDNEDACVDMLDITTSSGEEVAEKKPKRKRGRPTKPKTHSICHIMLDITTSSGEEVAEKKPKRKRGRPTKPKTHSICQICGQKCV